ncbi:MAG: hypothetical protein U0228_02125 [Myxococcaceae bacterium]
MIGPTTRVFGVVLSDSSREGHLARLYNYLFAFNHLDAAYVSYALKRDVVRATLDGFARTRPVEVLHVVPAFQALAGTWAAERGPIDTITFAPALKTSLGDASATWLAPDAVCARALRDVTAWFGRNVEAPPDWLAVVDEPALRPCKLTHDDFERHHVRRTA